MAYSDLDLSRDSDVILLKARAKAAAADVCREANRRAGSPLYLADERAPGTPSRELYHNFRSSFHSQTKKYHLTDGM